MSVPVWWTTSRAELRLLCPLLPRNANLYAVEIPSSASSAGEETVTINQVYVHAAVPKPATLAQDAVNQGLYWQGDLLDGAAAAFSQELPADAVKVRVKWVSLDQSVSVH